jgi:hypothetical protein
MKTCNKYESELANACVIAANVSASVRYDLLNNAGVDTIAAWIELDSAEDSKSLAVLRTTLARQSKALYGHGLKVEGGALVATAVRKRVVKEENAELMALAAYIVANASGDDITGITTVLANFVEQLKEKAAK